MNENPTMLTDEVEDPSTTRQFVLNLIKKKESIESEIEAFHSILVSNAVDMKDPLVDEDGYPRQDIDVYQVRHARHRIICLQNDHKAVMNDIENGLHKVHAVQQPIPMEVTDPVPQVFDPIAIVNEVTPDSPAEDAGLQVSDQILEFGSVNCRNFRNVQDIGSVAKSMINKPVVLLILRDKKNIHISLTPRNWKGRGLLGCNIIPVEPIDR